MSVRITQRQLGDVTILDCVGRITLGHGCNDFRGTVEQVLDQGKKLLLLNLAQVTYIDASGTGAFSSIFTLVTKHGGQIKLLNLTRRVKDLLQITKLYTVFEVFDDEAEALRSFP